MDSKTNWIAIGGGALVAAGLGYWWYSSNAAAAEKKKIEDAAKSKLPVMTSFPAAGGGTTNPQAASNAAAPPKDNGAVPPDNSATVDTPDNLPPRSTMSIFSTLSRFLPQASSSDPTLPSGPTTEEAKKYELITKAQTILQALGYPVAINGVYDFATQTAVPQYQKDNHFNPTGASGVDELDLLVVELKLTAALTGTPLPANI